ncbi:hypothetical protein BT69DRAFT_1297612 [Atractiella rhizophila]|nr:hypothetical protein BT69DRAFT_1297612 [Atractiella rhizophila]
MGKGRPTVSQKAKILKLQAGRQAKRKEEQQILVAKEFALQEGSHGTKKTVEKCMGTKSPSLSPLPYPVPPNHPPHFTISLPPPDLLHHPKTSERRLHSLQSEIDCLLGLVDGDDLVFCAQMMEDTLKEQEAEGEYEMELEDLYHAGQVVTDGLAVKTMLKSKCMMNPWSIQKETAQEEELESSNVELVPAAVYGLKLLERAEEDLPRRVWEVFSEGKQPDRGWRAAEKELKRSGGYGGTGKMAKSTAWNKKQKEEAMKRHVVHCFPIVVLALANQLNGLEARDERKKMRGGRVKLTPPERQDKPPAKKPGLNRNENKQAQEAKLERYEEFAKVLRKVLEGKQFVIILQSPQTGKYTRVMASETAAAAHGFGATYEGRSVRSWGSHFMKTTELPASARGYHPKSFSLLRTPQVREEFLVHMVPTVLESHAKKKQVNKDLPVRLKSYVNLKLFPRIEWKLTKGISKRTARRWLETEGFKWTRYKKGLYYDGHERLDVVKYRQELTDDPQEVIKVLPPSVKPVILVVHDETTCTANDGKTHSWMLEGRTKLRKKGQGRGIRHLVILQMRGLKSKLIPLFEQLHPGKQMLLLLDNSQGHSFFAKDALRATEMTLNPGMYFQAGGVQARVQPGWYEKDGLRIIQPMVDVNGTPKGIKMILKERRLRIDVLRGCCKKIAEHHDDNKCCAPQPDFQAQKSAVIEAVEATGLYAIMLPKFHCEINYIEFFWGRIKYYCCGLKRTIPAALKYVELSTIWKFEQRSLRWVQAYSEGKNVVDASYQVKKYSSHRRVPEKAASRDDYYFAD